jgi:hypothetical protein
VRVHAIGADDGSPQGMEIGSAVDVLRGAGMVQNLMEQGQNFEALRTRGEGRGEAGVLILRPLEAGTVRSSTSERV